LEVLEKPGDELTFLKRRHMLLSERELAIQSHPKHLEKLFEMMKINRGLKPKKVPVHQLLDEPDETEEWPQTRPRLLGRALASCFTLPVTLSSASTQSED
jgi:hypothetical protein